MLIPENIAHDKLVKRNEKIVLSGIAVVLQEVGYQTLDEVLTSLKLEESIFVRDGNYHIHAMDLKLQMITNYPNCTERVQRVLYEANDINLQQLGLYMKQQHREVKCVFITHIGQRIQLKLHTSQTPSTHEAITSKLRKYLSLGSEKSIQIKDGAGDDVFLNDETKWIESKQYFVVVSDSVTQCTQTPPRESRRTKKPRPDGMIEEIIFVERTIATVTSPKKDSKQEVRVLEPVESIKKKKKKKLVSSFFIPRPPEQPPGVVRMVRHIEFDIRPGEAMGMRINTTHIEGVSRRGPAALAGLTAGMDIKAVNNIKVYSYHDIENALSLYDGPHVFTVTSTEITGSW